MLVDDETSLAWALTEAARPHLSPAERGQTPRDNPGRRDVRSDSPTEHLGRR